VGARILTGGWAVTLAVAAMVAACARTAPTPTVPPSPPSSASASSPSSPSPSTSAPGSTPAQTCQIDLLGFVIASWEGAAGTAYSNIVIGLRDGGPAECTFDGPVQVALEGPSAPLISVEPPALPASGLLLQQGPIDAAGETPGQIRIPLALRNWCGLQPPEAEIRVGIGPLGQSALLKTTWPTPACTMPGAPAKLAVGPVRQGEG
jgi:hypothetical protein